MINTEILSKYIDYCTLQYYDILKLLIGIKKM